MGRESDDEYLMAGLGAVETWPEALAKVFERGLGENRRNSGCPPTDARGAKHRAHWPRDYNPDVWSADRRRVPLDWAANPSKAIGAGASAVVMASSRDIEELKKEFIVDEGTYEAGRLKEDLTRLLKFCRITSKGSVMITEARLTDKKRVGLVIVARYIGSHLDKKIAEVVSGEEIANYTKIDKEGVNARVKEVVDEGYATREAKGRYKANPGRIADFLNDILSK